MRSRAAKRAEQNLADSAVVLASKLGDANTFPSSIKFTNGNPISILTNTFDLTLSNSRPLFQYDVQFEPEILNPKLLRHIVYKAICPEGGPMGLNKVWEKVIYDGQHAMYTKEEGFENTYNVQMSQDNPEKVVVVTVKKVATIEPTNVEQLLQIYSIAFQGVYRVFGLDSSNRKWIDMSNPQAVSDLNIFRGYKPTITFLDHGLSYVLETATRIERNGTLYDYYKKYGYDNPKDWNKFDQSVKSLEITTTHTKKPKCIKVHSIVFKSNVVTDTFPRKDHKTGEERPCTYKDYYMQVYNINLPDDDKLAEVIQTRKGAQERIFYPLSILKMTGLTDAEIRSKSGLRMEIAKVTRTSANEKLQRLNEFVKRIREDEASKAFLDRWGFTVNSSKTLTGYSIAPPVLVDGKREYKIDPARPSYQSFLKNMKLARTVNLENPILFLASQSVLNEARELSHALKGVSKNLNIDLEKNIKEIPVKGDETEFYTNTIIEEIINRSKLPPCFVICMLNSDKKQRYDEIKSLLTVNLGIPSQIVVAKKNQKNIMSVATNIAIQIASKLDAALVRISRKSLTPQAKGTMLVGLSIQSGKGRGSTTIGAGVATIDFDLSRYYSKPKVVDDNKTLDEEFLKEFFANALEGYKQTTGEDPARIIVYREGVSYGLMPQIKEHECKIIQDIIPPTTHLAVVICQKHGNISVMLERNGKAENCSSGTVVTDGVSVAHVGEFYLISHHANQGMARPTRYTVIHQTPLEEWDNELLVKLTHYSTMVYSNWPGPIRIPSVLMLAGRLAEFTRSNLSGNAPAARIEGHLHYL